MKYVAVCIFFFTSLLAYGQHKGINFQAVLKKPDGTFPTVSGLTVTLQILDPNNDCVLREEVHSGVNISNGYINLIVGNPAAATPPGKNPASILTLTQIMDNVTARTGLNCIDANDNIVLTNQTYTPSNSDRRKLRLRAQIGSDLVVADFNMRSVPFAVNSETLNGKTEASFVQITSDVTQANVDALFAPGVYNNLLSLTSGNTTAVTLPSGTTAQRPGSPSVGMFRYNSTTGNVEFYNGSAWTGVGAGSVTSVTAADTTVTVGGTASAPTVKANVGTAAGTVAAGDDARIVGAIQNAGNTPNIQTGAEAAKPTSNGSGRLYISSDGQRIYRDDNSVGWSIVGTRDYNDLINKPAASGYVPSQTGNSGKFLTTDGTNASWAALSVPWSSVTSTPTTLAGYSISDALKNFGNSPGVMADITANKPTPNAITPGKIFVDTSTLKTYRDNGVSWDLIGSLDYADLANKPTADSLLPSQTGNAGKVLTTNGTTVSWGSVAGDNLGNHTATANVQLNGHWLSGDGGNEGLAVDSSGKVGVGTTAPNTQVELVSASPELRLHNNSGQNSRISFHGGADFEVASLSVDTLSHTTLSALGSLTFKAGTGNGFKFQPNGNTTNTLIIDSAGNVGINSASPTSKLEVVGSSGSTLKIVDGNQGAGKVLQSDANGNASWVTLGGSESTSVSNVGSAGTGIYKQMTGSNIELKKLNAGSNKVVITDDAANSKIDLDVDQTKLSIAWSQLTSVPTTLAGYGITDAIGSATLTTKGDLLVRDGTAPTRLGVGTDGFVLTADSAQGSGLKWAAIPSQLPAQTGNNGKYLTTDGTSASWATISGDNLGNHTATQNIILGSNWLSGDGGNEGLRVDATGQVGIGTSVPGAALGVNGDIQFTNAAARTISIADSPLGTVGRAITIQAGGTGATATGIAGGGISLISGAAGQNSQGGNISLTTSSGGTNSVYGDITMSGRNFTFSGPLNSGGYVSITAGSNGSSTGGNATLSAGTGATGGALNVNGGDGTAGGAATFRAGDGTANGSTGGNVTLRAGDSWRSTVGGNYAPGTVTIRGGNATGNANSAAGGAVTITGGQAGVSGGAAGGLVTVTGGPAAAAASSVGGGVTISGAAGSSTGTGGSGGDVTISGGNAAGTGANNGGNITINGGTKTSTGNNGNVIIAGTSGKVAIGTTSVNELLTLEGVASLKAVSAPSATATYGKVYVDSADSKLKYMNPSGSITDLTAGLAPAGSATEIQFRSSGTAFGANSNFVWDNTNSRLGIGTSAPGYQVQIKATDAQLQMDGTNSSNLMLNVQSASDIAPQIQLYKKGASGLNGNLYQVGKINFNQFTSTWSSANVGEIIVANEGTPTDTSMPTSMSFATTNSSSAFRSEKMRITSAGNVGIGTTSPTGIPLWSAGKTLHIYDSANLPNIRLNGPSAHDLTIGTDLSGTYIRNSSNSYLSLHTNATERMIILGNGNVGINSGAPTTKLDVVGTSGTTLKIVDGNQGNGKVLTSDANGVASWATAAAGNPAGSANEVQFRNGAAFGANSNFVWDNTNTRLGIGTSAPQNQLHVHSTGTIAGVNFSTAATGATATDGFTVGYDDSMGAMLLNREVAALHLGTSGAPRVTIASDGKVGIGTATMDALSHKLEVYGGGTRSIFINSADNTGSGIGFKNTDTGGRTYQIMSSGSLQQAGAGKMVFYDQTAGLNRLVLDSSGYVGIGSNSPSGILDVNGGTAAASTNGTNITLAAQSAATSGFNGGNINLTPGAAVGAGVTGGVRVTQGAISAAYTSISNLTVDFSKSNIITTSASCGAVSLSNMQDGGSYTLIVTGSTSGTCTFSHAGVTWPTGYKFYPDNGATDTTSSGETVYTFLKVGPKIYVSWITGMK